MRVAYVDDTPVEYDDSTVFEVQGGEGFGAEYETRWSFQGGLSEAVCCYRCLKLEARGSKKRLVVKNGSCVAILREAFCRGHGLPDVSSSF